ncbi:isoamylase [Kitasatospora sp. MMS16-BH015]|uniref:glycogen debranching protein GlgX n=1 Tax=Kitasatospora sp. MMS16-BH015 TaxID=2018025 RepID=UPI000CA1490A|nr:glycogen debranching protein GlgX [Kitasatospora sp. MMS16-BH015]AUG78040.1 isoamylase [Kitasatospora sp. MMS16-BH015]
MRRYSRPDAPGRPAGASGGLFGQAALPSVLPGRPQPLGAVPDAGGVNFSVFSQHASSVELLLFDAHDAPAPSRVITLDPERHRTFHFWHCHVAGLRPGQVYAYRMDGPGPARESGTRFAPRKVLLDPYARANVNTLWDRLRAVGPEDNCASSMRSTVVDLAGYDWEGVQPPRTPLTETVLYELHVGGFTASPTSRTVHPGTFSAVVEKIPHLLELGVTAVQLMPVFDFDERRVLRTGPDGAPLHDYWGYAPFGFFAPHTGYCSDPLAGTHVTEFRDMVKALHRAGIEVILDVTFTHTSEGDENGPTISFRGQANETYYHLWPQDRRRYMDFTGRGNAINANHPAVAKLVIECLEYWVTEHHVDGFRFGLASELARGDGGSELEVPPVLWAVELSSVLTEAKIIAEPWDGGGIYQVGHFPGKRWLQWNGPYRDDVRRFVRGEGGLLRSLAHRLGGSPDVFRGQGQLPTNSVNFVTCHEGFTLNDLVSYDHRHNLANGQAGVDGAAENFSWNCGIEGPTEDPAVERLRARQVRNLLALLLLSRGVPMLLAGDEFRNSQGGNNNADCQPNETSWLDWDQAAKEEDLRRFVREMIALRRRHEALSRAQFYPQCAAVERAASQAAAVRRGEVRAAGAPARPTDGPSEAVWHGTRLGKPGWDDPEARVLALTLAGRGGRPDLHLILNMSDKAQEFELPADRGGAWLRLVDTARPAPEDILPPGSEAPVEGLGYVAEGHSIVVLVAADAPLDSD